MWEERHEAVQEEVARLLAANFISEVRFHTWVANIILVRKANGKWRMYVDYTDLIKACPKDAYPLPRIDQLVDATVCHEFLNFMDAYSGYNQIVMHPNDQQKTTFYTGDGIYCYNVMLLARKMQGPPSNAS